MKYRRNFLPTLILNILFWLLLGWIVFYNTPGSPSIILIFYILFFISLFLTLSLLFANSRRGFLITFGIISLMILQQLQMINIINLTLIVGLIVSAEIYSSKH